MTDLTRSRRLRLAEWLWPALATALITLAVRASDFDLGAQRWIYKIGGGNWSLGDHPFWKLLYAGGTLPASLVVFAALGVFAFSWAMPRLRRWRRAGLFLVLSAVIGPGLIANGILKEHWGRPRPREVIEFGGRHEFEPVLSYHAESHGMSFPCGHATMGFFFLAFYFLLRQRRPGLAQAAVFAALAAGGLMGIARMTQGAHFFSDMIWAAVVCWYTPLLLAFPLGLYREGTAGEEGHQKMPRWLKVALPVLGVGMLGAVLLATPHGEKRTYTLSAPMEDGAPLRLRLELVRGNVAIQPGESLQIDSNSSGHGLPTSKIARNYLEVPDEEDGGVSVTYTERISGWFTELNAELRVGLPWTQLQRLRLDTGEAEVSIVLPETAGRSLIELGPGGGKVRIVTGGKALDIDPLDDPRVRREGAGGAAKERGTYRVRLSPEFAGQLEIMEASP